VSFKTINGYEYDENGYNLGTWCASQRQQQKQGKLSEERRKKLEDIEFRIEVKKIIRLQWNEWYKLLEAYYKEHGNTEIPWGFKTINGYEYDENGVTLGTWCVAQRQKQDKLGESKRRKLEDIKFRFEVKNNDENWEKMYELAKVYYEKYGNTEIPGNFKTVNGYEYDENGVTLGQWCSTQRHNRDNLKDARRKKLEDIEFRFEGNLKDIKWEKMYELAKIYYEKHGNSRIKVSFKTINGYEYDENGVTLGLWIHTQRQEQDRLGNEKKKKLEEIDFLFKINKNTRMPWEEWYSLLKAHYDYHGIPTVPHNFKTINGYEYDENGVTLGYWCHTQRINRNILNEERRIKLEEIGFNFEYNDYQKLKWEKMYKLVKAYYEHFGNLRIPSDFKTLNGYEYNENGEILYDWCEIQRTSQNTLNEDQIKKLEEIEFQFKIKKHWEKRYELLKKYYICHGIPIVPSNFKTINGYEYDENGIALGDWCNRQRVNRDILNEDQIKKLEEIGFNFEYNDYKKLKWEKMYELVKAYYEHFGNLRIPPDFKTLNGYEYNENGEILWDWCIIQKQKKANLSEEQRKKLDDLGFSSIKKETTVERKKEITVERKKEITVERKKETSEERKKILCNVYGINYEKYDFIKKIAYKELYAKIQYLIENNYLVTENGRIHEIFIISNEHMQLEYHISKEELISRYYVNDKKRGK